MNSRLSESISTVAPSLLEDEVVGRRLLPGRACIRTGSPSSRRRPRRCAAPCPGVPCRGSADPLGGALCQNDISRCYSNVVHRTSFATHLKIRLADENWRRMERAPYASDPARSRGRAFPASPQPDALGIPARPRPHHPFRRLPAPAVQDPGLPPATRASISAPG